MEVKATIEIFIMSSRSTKIADGDGKVEGGYAAFELMYMESRVPSLPFN